MYMDQARVAALVGGNPRFADPKSEPPGYYIWQGTENAGGTTSGICSHPKSTK